MILAERDEHLRILDGLLDELVQGAGRVAVVHSGVCVGKTAMLAEFGRRANRAGARVVTATASRAEQELSFGVMDQLLHGAGADDLLPDEPPAAAEQADDATPRVPATMLFQLAKTLIGLAQSGPPLVLVVDDVHYSDAASLQCLAYVIRRIRTTPMLVVLSESTSVRQAHPEYYLELMHQPHARRIQLQSLSPAGVRAVLEHHLRGPVTDALVSGVYAAGAGNPLMTRALVDDLQDANATEVVPGEALDRAVMACLYRGDPAVLQHAQALAVLGGSGSATTRAQLARLTPDSGGWAGQVLRRAGLTCPDGHLHPRAGQAILDSIGPCQRRELHDRAAQLLYQEGAAAIDVARQLVDGAVRPQWAVRLLREAGHQALIQGEATLAASFLRAAQTADPDSTEAQAQADLLHIEWRRDPGVVVRHLDTLTEAAGNELLDPPGALAQVLYLLWHGRLDQAFGLAAQLAGTVGADPCTSAAFRTTCLWLAFTCPSRADRVSHLVEGTQTPIGAFGPRDQAATLLHALRTGEITTDSVVAAERALQQHRPGDGIGMFGPAVATLAIANQLELASTWVRRFASAAAEANARTWMALSTAYGAELALRQGNLMTAETEAETALRMLSTDGWGAMIGLPLSTLLLSTSAAGKHEVTAAYLSTPVPAATFDTLPGLMYVRARGYHYLSTRRYRSALNDFHTCQQQAMNWEIDIPAVMPWRNDTARAYLRMGDQRRALHLLHEQLQRLQETLPQHQRVRGSTLRTLAAASDVKKRPALLKDAIQALEQSGDQLELAHAYADLGKALYALGEPHEARGRLRSAQYIAKQCSALHLLRTLAPQTETPVRPAVPERPKPEPGLKIGANELSSAEQRVAALAAQGHTNREIATKLFLTVSTVEQHLTRVYRKLNVAGRSDLTPDLTPGL
jgi:DNA-binding CsgD family transcriptional regulator